METIGLIISCILTLGLIVYLSTRDKKTQLQKIVILDSVLAFCWCFFGMVQKYFSTVYNINPLYFDYFIYIFICFLPVSIFFTGFIFANTKIKFKKKYLLLFVVPILSLIMLWTNNLHHLFYVNYATDMSQTTFGIYFHIHNAYTLMLYFIGLVYLLTYSIKNAGIFSRQAIFIILAALLPLTVNILGAFQIVPVNIYLTPICFSFTILLCALAIFKFKLLTVTPIALQRIVDRMSDSYLVLNEDDTITDFNQTFLTTFKLDSSNVRNRNIFDLISSRKEKLIDEKQLKQALKEVKNSTKTITFDKEFKAYKKFFHIEINTITSRQNFLGTLILFKDTTQHMLDMQTIKDNQNMLMEKERLASLGQMIGGISHNLKTPIMSIAGAAEGLTDLINEYDSSIGDKEVTIDDHHAIANDMRDWVDKIHSYTGYMSDIITAVKGQAVALSESEQDVFTIDELVKRVDILMKHDLKNCHIQLNVNLNGLDSTQIHGNVNSLVQVVNNLISNAIQSYAEPAGKSIELVTTSDGKAITISVIDHGSGIPKDVQEKLFKSMITTKGKNGTGLGMFMSYSTIKGHFNGDMNFSTELGKGTTFNIVLPVS